MAALTTVVVAAAATAVAGAVAGAGAAAGTGVGAAPTPQQVTAEAPALLGAGLRLKGGWSHGCSGSKPVRPQFLRTPFIQYMGASDGSAGY